MRGSLQATCCEVKSSDARVNNRKKSLPSLVLSVNVTAPQDGTCTIQPSYSVDFQQTNVPLWRAFRTGHQAPISQRRQSDLVDLSPNTQDSWIACP